MAEKNRYPQIPSTVWWGVRSILQKTPTATIDERLLGVGLGVQEVAARQYIGELRSVGLLTEEGKATPLAQKWRLDESYSEAAAELIAASYPEGLRHLAPPGEADRQKVVSWFLREGLGQGAAGNKAATYLLLGSASPNEAPSRGGARAPKEAISRTSKETAGKRASANQSSANAKAAPNSPDQERRNDNKHGQNRAGWISPEGMPLNINVQIHISADAGTEQIESIFSAMRRYLYDTQNS